MTEIPKAIILDLLPAYTSGEASAETIAVVEKYLENDPQLAARLRSQSANGLKTMEPLLVPAELELVSIRRAKRLMRWQRWLLIMALCLSYAALEAEAVLGEWRMKPLHLLLKSNPFLIGILPILALICWIAYFWLKQRLRSAGA